MPPKTSWSWGRGDECRIDADSISVGRADPWGGNGASCSLGEFLDGQLTWLLPDDVRREALASVQQMLGDHRPLPDRVLRGDWAALTPGVRKLAKARARLEKEQAREKLERWRPVQLRELADRRCVVCRQVFDRNHGNRPAFTKILARFPHAQHACTLETLDRRIADLRSDVGRVALADCEICRELPASSTASRVRELAPAARRMAQRPALAPYGDAYRQCPTCGRLYFYSAEGPHYDWNEEPADDDPTERLERIDVDDLRRALFYRIAEEGQVPDWIARATDAT